MLALGIHFGLLSVRLSQSYELRADGRLGLEPVRRPNYGVEDWISYFDGALPNAIDRQTGRVGYAALERVGPANSSRLDQEFLLELLDPGDKASQARRVLKELLSVLRSDFMTQKLRAHIVLFLEAMDFTSPTSRWTPWVRQEDKTPQLEETLREIGGRFGFRGFHIATEVKVLQNYIAHQTKLHPGDVLITIGLSTQAWRVDHGGKIAPATKRAAGLWDLLAPPKRREPSHSSPTDQLLKDLQLTGHQDSLVPSGQSYHQWSNNTLLPMIRRIGRLHPDARILLAGEGACLVWSLLERELPPTCQVLNDWYYLHAHGAAILAHGELLKEG